ncbi:hypothetical protein ACIBJC_30540 [Streptomyces sp. NPDC050509]|uniref:hypothetical protein n=1 Tax=Streptomyces sp. NPDC050509 TaxID=3365620 RepID=UPI0037A4ED88
MLQLASNNAEHHIAARGNDAREVIGVGFRLPDPRQRLPYLATRKANPVFQFAEALWYLAGRRDLEMIGHYAPSMRSSSPDGITLGGSAYGYTLFNPADGDTASPFDRVLELLRTETDSKRGYLPVFSASELAVSDNPDMACLTVLVTHSNIQNPAVEPVDSNIAAESLRTLYEHAERYRTVLYWRPIVPGLNDSDSDIARARELSLHAHATVFTGLFFRDEIAAYYEAHGLTMPYEETARRKIMPETAEQRILDAFERDDSWGALFRKTSCGVAYAQEEADYNGHYGIRELCDICPPEQVAKCRAAWLKPDLANVIREARGLGATGPIEVNDRAIVVEGLDEPPRYYLQHGFGFQCHDQAKPHHHRRHGRAPIGWKAENGNTGT